MFETGNARQLKRIVDKIMIEESIPEEQHEECYLYVRMNHRITRVSRGNWIYQTTPDAVRTTIEVWKEFKIYEYR